MTTKKVNGSEFIVHGQDKKIFNHEPQAKRTPNHPLTMADLMASLDKKPLIFSRGERVEGEVAAITEGDIIVDLGTKSEGVISKRDLSPEQVQNLKIGDLIQAFVVFPEGESGEVILSLFSQPVSQSKRSAELQKKWQKFITAMQHKTTVQGRITEVNKGGLVAEAGGARGFIPSSQVGLDNLSGSEGLSGLIGQELPLHVIEVDLVNSRLIFSARKQISEETKQKLAAFQPGQEVAGRVAAVAPFGLFVDLGGVEGIIFSQEVAWEEPGNLNDLFKVGQEVTGKVTGKDESAGKVMVSLRQMMKDPFTELAEKFQTDDVVSGVVKEVAQNGVLVKLESDVDGPGLSEVEGFVPGEKVESGNEYAVGQKGSFLVDSVDKTKRRINLATFLTTTKGLIYK